jgi:hypothetical protein
LHKTNCVPQGSPQIFSFREFDSRAFVGVSDFLFLAVVCTFPIRNNNKGRETGRETGKKKFLLQQELHEVVFWSRATSKPVLRYVIPTCAEKREIHYSAAASAAAADGTQSCDLQSFFS